jgi:rod shape-determining protein MreD
MSFVYSSSFGGLDFLKVTILGLFLIAVQGAASPWLGAAAPEAAAVLVVYVVWRSEKWVAVLAAFILGFFRDAAGSGLLGVYQVALILLAWAFYAWRRRVHLESPPALMFCVFGLTLGHSLLIVTPLTALLGWPGPGFNPVPALLASALTTALAAPPLFWLLKRLTGDRADGF